MIDVGHVPDVALAGAMPVLERYRIAPARPEDRGHIVRTWTDSFHRARGNSKRPFRGGWKDRTQAAISTLLDAPTTRVLCAYHETERVLARDGRDLGPAVLGWIAWTPGRSIATVHYVYVRHSLGGVLWRRRGVMAELVEAADLGRRVAYTHRGEYARGSERSHQHWPRPLDEEIVDWLRGRGVTAVYVPLAEWLA